MPYRQRVTQQETARAAYTVRVEGKPLSWNGEQSTAFDDLRANEDGGGSYGDIESCPEEPPVGGTGGRSL